MLHYLESISPLQGKKAENSVKSNRIPVYFLAEKRIEMGWSFLFKIHSAGKRNICVVSLLIANCKCKLDTRTVKIS